MDKDVLSFTEIQINNDFLKEIWTMNPKNLDELKGSKLSSYAVALSMYLIYFKYQRNKDKAEIQRLNTYIERTISLSLAGSPDLLKKFNTKKAATEYLITTNLELMSSQTKLEAVKKDILQTEGMDKAISELIATIKRELTRRENELYQTRMERR